MATNDGTKGVAAVVFALVLAHATPPAPGFWPPLAAVNAWIDDTDPNDLVVRFSVHDPHSGDQHGFWGGFYDVRILQVDAGIVAWIGQTLVAGDDDWDFYYAVYDPHSTAWRTGRAGFTGIFQYGQLINHDGVVAWQRHPFGSSWDVGYATYDPKDGAWKKGTWHTDWNIVGILCNEDGVVAWLENAGVTSWVHHAVYDPGRRAWMYGSFGGFSALNQNLSIEAATATWIADGEVYTRGYSHTSGSWNSEPTEVLAHFVPSGDFRQRSSWVWFTDMSIAATSWSWQFDECGTSSERSPHFTFDHTGFPSVTQSAAGPAGEDAAAAILNLCGEIPTVLLVDASVAAGCCGGCGTTWEDAIDGLQKALLVAGGSGGAVQEIWVAEGTYRPDRGTGDRTATFQLVNGVSVYGGFPVGGGTWNERDPDLYETVLSGDLSGDDVEVAHPQDLLTEPSRAENAYHVLTANSNDETATLDGFRIQGGNASESDWPHDHAGGLLIEWDSRPTIRGCFFTRNSATFGAGLFTIQSSPSIVQCIFSNNAAVQNGGGLENYDHSLPVIDNCTFSSNFALRGGGIANNNHSDPTITDCNFNGNTATSVGGGMWNINDVNAVASNCTFTANTAREGGAVKNDECSPTFVGCAFHSNSAVVQGGGMCNEPGSPILVNCVFTENATTGSEGWGGGMRNTDQSHPTLTRCLFGQNSATHGGAIACAGASFTASECTFEGNTASSGGAIDNWLTSASVSACSFSGNTADYGGAAFLGNNSSGVLENCTFSGNSANFAGGAVHIDASSPTLTQCTFVWNATTGPDGDGGAVRNVMGSAPTVTACTFNENTAVRGGGGMANAASDPYISACLFQNNSAWFGAGVQNWSSHPTLHNCSFSQNVGTDSGGGLCNNNMSSPIVSNCTISGNSAGNAGGGVFNDEGCNPRFTDCVFHANTAVFGGGMLNYLNSPCLERCTFTENAAQFGGAMDNYQSSPWVVTCTFATNWVEAFGGGVDNYGESSLPIFIGCLFVGNSAVTGGGVFNEWGSSPTLVNCLFSGNLATHHGGAMRCQDDHPRILNCTFAYNTAQIFGGALAGDDGSTAIVIQNCILWGNADSTGSEETAQIHGGTPLINYSCVQGWTGGFGGAGNTGAEPLFADPDGPDDVMGTEDDDLRLLPGSPCVDAGDNANPPHDWLDLDGDGCTTDPLPVDLDANARYVDDPNTPDTGRGAAPIIDMGAYEFASTPNLQPGACLADSNCDNLVDFDDINPFVLALSDPAGYQATFPNCNILNADCNADGAVDFDDINGFVAILSGG